MIEDIRMTDNIYHRTSKQLQDFLKSKDIPISYVSRVFIGNKDFYHLEFNIPEDESVNLSTIKLKKLLNLKNVGLVDFHETKNYVHIVYLVDEDELQDKYLKDGNLVFDDAPSQDQELKESEIIRKMLEELDPEDIASLLFIMCMMGE